MKKMVMLIMVMGLMMGGCAGIATNPNQTENLDYGLYPTNYENIVRSHFEMRLFDPFSAQYRFDKPYKGYTRVAPIVGGGIDEVGYILTIWINAKNRMGGYTGWKRHTLLIKNDIVAREVFPNPWFQEGWYR